MEIDHGALHKRKSQAQHLLKDTLRVIGLMVVATGLLILSTRWNLPDPAMAPVFTSSAILLYFAALTHIIRRVLFPTLDLVDFMVVILRGDNPPQAIGAGLFIFGAFYLTVGLFQTFVSMLR